jgi:hypothetical protein
MPGRFNKRRALQNSLSLQIQSSQKLDIELWLLWTLQLFHIATKQLIRRLPRPLSSATLTAGSSLQPALPSPAQAHSKGCCRR